MINGKRSWKMRGDQLLQANTLKALREELKLAKKDATDWALNHEKEKRAGEALGSRLHDAYMICVVLVALVISASYTSWRLGHVEADHYWHEHILEVSDRPQGKVLYQLLGSKRCLGFDYHETPAADDPERVVDFYYMVLDSGTCKFEVKP